MNVLTVDCTVLAHRCCERLPSEFLWITIREEGMRDGAKRDFETGSATRVKAAAIRMG